MNRTDLNILDMKVAPLRVKVAHMLREEITSGRLPLGSQISEQSIAEDLQISRTPVREAIMSLAVEGLVDVRPQSGTYVFGPDPDEIVSICQMRLVLESAALKILAKSDHKEIFVQTLVDNVRQASKALSVSLEECHQLDTAFHRALIEASENPFLIQSYHGISNRLHALRQLLPFTKTRLNAALKQHRQLIAAIKQNDIKDAQSIIEEHIANVEAMLLERLDKPRDSHTVIRSRGSRRV